MSKSYEIVPFHEHEILTVQENGQVLIALKPLVEAMGLVWNGQFERIKRHPVMSKGIRVTRIPSQGGMQETVCLALEMLPGFLMTVQTDRIRDAEVRQRVILFQEDAFRVLFQHYFGRMGKKEGHEHLPSAAEIIRLVDAVKREHNSSARALYYEMLEQNCAARGVKVPALIDLSQANEYEADAERVMERIDWLTRDKPELNHHRQGNMIAVRLREIEANGLPLSKPQREALRRHPHFAGAGAVNSRDGKTRHCWIFRRAALH